MVDKSLVEKLFDAQFFVEGKYSIDSNGVVNVQGNLSYTRDAMGHAPESLPVEFGTVTGDFWSTSKGLKNWKNFPKFVGGMLVVDDNHFTDWKGCPTQTGSLIIANNPIDSLTGMPSVHGSLDVSNCELSNFEGMREPIPSWVSVRNNPLRTFEGFLGCSGYLAFSYNHRLPLLRTLLAQGGVRIYPPDVDDDDNLVVPDMSRLLELQEIINRYKGQGRAGAFDCRRELRAAGFEENARW